MQDHNLGFRDFTWQRTVLTEGDTEQDRLLTPEWQAYRGPLVYIGDAFTAERLGCNPAGCNCFFNFHSGAEVTLSCCCSSLPMQTCACCQYTAHEAHPAKFVWPIQVHGSQNEQRGSPEAMTMHACSTTPYIAGDLYVPMFTEQAISEGLGQARVKPLPAEAQHNGRVWAIMVRVHQTSASLVTQRVPPSMAQCHQRIACRRRYSCFIPVYASEGSSSVRPATLLPEDKQWNLTSLTLSCVMSPLDLSTCCILLLKL